MRAGLCHRGSYRGGVARGNNVLEGTWEEEENEGGGGRKGEATALTYYLPAAHKAHVPPAPAQPVDPVAVDAYPAVHVHADCVGEHEPAPQ